MVGQSLGSVVLAGLCLWYFVPDVFIDTTGGSQLSCLINAVF